MRIGWIGCMVFSLLGCGNGTSLNTITGDTANHALPTRLETPVNQLGNQIINGMALQPLRLKISRAKQLSVIKILHIGDSHIKSGFFSEPFIANMNRIYVNQLKRNVFFNGQTFCKVGTKYADYNDLAELDQQLISEQPDLVIISLGTNDAFSGSYKSGFYNKIDRLVKKVDSLAKGASLLLTTPADALKPNRTTGTYAHLPELEFVVEQIIRYATDHKMAYWNLHQVMGGSYSMNRWVQKKLAAPDHIHFTPKGYAQIAGWLSAALVNSLESKTIVPTQPL